MAVIGVAAARGFAALDAVSAVARRYQRPTGGRLANESTLVLILIGIGLLLHGFNMLNYPAFSSIGDEGVYAQQAWAVLREHRLSPYTYIYDHAPAGWMLLALWMAVTGGPDTFGGAIASGRVLMLLLHLASILLLYRLMRKLGSSVPAAALGTLFFTCSPLSILNSRLVLLDNIAVFWVLLSLDQLMDGWGRLSRVALSGALFGVAALSKETALVITPAVLLLAYLQRWQHQGRFAVGVWVVPMLMVCSWYPLYAILKGELFPSADSGMYELSKAVAGSTGHASLLGAAGWQLSRAGGSAPFSVDNAMFQLARLEWLPRDPVLLIVGGVGVLVAFVRALSTRAALPAALLAALPIAFFARGGVVFQHYIVFILPFLCVCIAILLDLVFSRLRARWLQALACVVILGLAALSWLRTDVAPLYAQRPSDADREAVAWIKQNLSPASLIVSDDALWADLHEGGRGGPSFPHVESHWKVASDPAIRGGVFRNDWRSVDYVVMTPGEDQAVFAPANNTLVLEALAHASLVKEWDADDQVIIQLWKVDKAGTTETKVLTDASASISQRFERQGAFTDIGGTVVAESQAYAMLRSAWLDDRPAFYRTWAWTQAHLSKPSGLLAWLWRDGSLIDSHAPTDANVDAALALLVAGQRWNDGLLTQAGTQLVRAIWNEQVVFVDDTPYLSAGDWDERSVVVLNPGYFAPYALHFFAAVDADHDWYSVIDSGYDALFSASSSLLGGERSSGLPPNWVGLTLNGEIVELPSAGDDTTIYGADAARAFWRIALDWQWTGDGRAQAFLQQAAFLRDQFHLTGYIRSAYAHDGTPLADAPSTVGNAGALGALLELDPSAAASLYASQLLGGAIRDGSLLTWGSPTALYTQEWAWFGTALYARAMPRPWDGQ